MNTPQITELIKDASYALAILAEVTSPAFRQAAVRQLARIVREFHDIEFAPNHPDIANQLQAATPEPEQPTLKESVEKFHDALATAAEDRPVIDLAMKYRTRDGREVKELRFAQEAMTWVAEGTVGDDLMYWTIYGGYDFDSNGEKPDPLDLIPTGEPA
jgi:hypothetical protein